MDSGSEHRTTGRVFSCLSIATSKYSWTVIVHHITHEIFNNIVAITKMHQVTAFSCRFWRKCNCLQKAEIKNENVRIVRCTRNLMSWHLYQRTRKSSPCQPLWSVRCTIPTFDVNQCSLRGSTFCFCLLRLGLAVTGAPAEHFGTRIHGVILASQPSRVGSLCPAAPPTDLTVVTEVYARRQFSHVCPIQTDITQPAVNQIQTHKSRDSKERLFIMT